MRQVRIDFAPPGIRRSLLRAPAATWALAAMILCLVPLLASTGLKYRDLQREQARRATQMRLRALVPPPAAIAARAVLPAAQVDAMNAAVRQLNLPWRSLHDAIQAATPATIGLLALEPDARKNNMRITAEAKNSDDMIAYVEDLQQLEWFSGVLLVRHEINEQDPRRPIRFQIDAQWGRGP